VVITGLVPVIHVLLCLFDEGVHGRVKPGHDGKYCYLRAVSRRSQ
jgi:hypothetical protein